MVPPVSYGYFSCRAVYAFDMKIICTFLLNFTENVCVKSDPCNIDLWPSHWYLTVVWLRCYFKVDVVRWQSKTSFLGRRIVHGLMKF